MQNEWSREQGEGSVGHDLSGALEMVVGSPYIGLGASGSSPDQEPVTGGRGDNGGRSPTGNEKDMEERGSASAVNADSVLPREHLSDEAREELVVEQDASAGVSDDRLSENGDSVTGLEESWLAGVPDPTRKEVCLSSWRRVGDLLPQSTAVCTEREGSPDPESGPIIGSRADTSFSGNLARGRNSPREKDLVRFLKLFCFLF